MIRDSTCALRSSPSGSSQARTKAAVRRFDGPWVQAWPRMELYLLEIFAARPEPSTVHIRFAKSLVGPDELRRDVPGLREALAHRLGEARVRCEAVDDADRHELRIEWTRPRAVESS